MPIKNIHIKVLIPLLLFLYLSRASQAQKSCWFDKGIKTARVVAKVEGGKNSKGESREEVRVFDFDPKGRPVTITEGFAGENVFKRDYENGKMLRVISIRLDLPDFYMEDELESLKAKAKKVSDTATVITNHPDGRPAVMKYSTGQTCYYEYNGCEEDLVTIVEVTGDTTQQMQTFHKDGVIVESTGTVFYPNKSNFTTLYYDYKYDKRGHWIERKYQRNVGTVVEKRKLTYY